MGVTNFCDFCDSDNFLSNAPYGQGVFFMPFFPVCVYVYVCVGGYITVIYLNATKSIEMTYRGRDVVHDCMLGSAQCSATRAQEKLTQGVSCPTPK